jgi:hypothetical protein
MAAQYSGKFWRFHTDFKSVLERIANENQPSELKKTEFIMKKNEEFQALVDEFTESSTASDDTVVRA